MQGVVTRRRILCIEDDADTCELLAVWLGLYNCSVTSAATMARGVQLAHEETLRSLHNRFAAARWYGGGGLQPDPRLRLSYSDPVLVR